MPNLEITAPALDGSVKQKLAVSLDACFRDIAKLDIGLNICFIQSGDFVWPQDQDYLHMVLYAPRLHRDVKQALVEEFTSIFKKLTGLSAPVIHIDEHSYDNIGVEGQLLSDMVPALRERKFYYELT